MEKLVHDTAFSELYRKNILFSNFDESSAVNNFRDNL